MSSPPPVNSHDSDPRQFLLGRINYERQTEIPYRSRSFKLDRMLRLLEGLGSPQQKLPAVHIAGTKGKGSTAAMVSRCLQVAGYRTGLYTSPHLRDVTERLQIDGQPCHDRELQSLVDRIRPVVEAFDREEEYPVTYFEIVTALALLHFVQQKVDVAVLEVGLGGRLDSTNVCHPIVSLITTISLDHTEQLGNSIAEIAREKAGIIKPGVPVICGQQEAEAAEVIESVAARRGASCIRLGSDFDFRYHPPSPGRTELATMDYLVEGAGRLEACELGLRGRHQAANAALALAALDTLHERGWECSPEARREGLRSANCPARLEVVLNRPTVVIDAAHNAASVRALVDTLQESGWGSGGRRVLIFATSRDKDVEAMFQSLLPHFDDVFVTQYAQNLRAAPVDELREAARKVKTEGVAQAASAVEAWHAAWESTGPEDLICVTGSFFLAAELRPLALQRAQLAPQQPVRR